MNKINYFPLGIAKGDAFCNRVAERKQLINNIEKNRHTIVISPRRYGKSSLVLYSLDEIKIPYERVDLFVAVNAATISDQILKGVKKLLNKISNKPESLINSIKGYLTGLSSKWVVGTDGVSIELIPNRDNDPITIIMESLQMLECVLQKKGVQAVFFIDEFQEVGVLAHSSGIEGAIRHVAQETKMLRFVFSGSNRHILASMFDDRSRPLYMLCDRMTVDRIHAQDYSAYFNKIAKKSWQQNIDQSTIDEIFKLTERHPYYINVLCDKLWDRCETNPPTVDMVTNTWLEYVMQEESKIAKEISSLSTAQKKLLIAVAQGQTKNLSSKSKLHAFEISSGAVIKALQVLEEADYLNRDQAGQYFVVDPLVKYSMILHYPMMAHTS